MRPLLLLFIKFIGGAIDPADVLSAFVQIARQQILRSVQIRVVLLRGGKVKVEVVLEVTRLGVHARDGSGRCEGSLVVLWVGNEPVSDELVTVEVRKLSVRQKRKVGPCSVPGPPSNGTSYDRSEGGVE